MKMLEENHQHTINDGPTRLTNMPCKIKAMRKQCKTGGTLKKKNTAKREG